MIKKSPIWTDIVIDFALMKTPYITVAIVRQPHIDLTVKAYQPYIR